MRFLLGPERRSTLRPRRRREWGQGLVEFALALPVLLVIIFLVIEAAFVVQAYLAVENAAREAVRWAITYQPVQGEQLDGTPCTNLSAGDTLEDFLFTNAGYNCDPTENTDEYNARRVALIKEVALDRAAGLRIRQTALGLTEASFQAYFRQPGFFGVRVWGFPSFEESERMDHPGLPGLPVRVQVVHNVELLDPLFRAMTTYVRVEAHAEMINEGIQVGFGNLPPPTFNPPPTFVVTPEGATPTTGPAATPTPTPVVTEYRVDIGFDSATNRLPDERGHTVPVTVRDGSGNPLSNVLVSFSTDYGAYDFSGVSPWYVKSRTDASGLALQTVYANEPGYAGLRAWIDFDSDNVWEAGEPYDVASKAWETEGPYIVASNHDVLPLDWIAVSVYDHPPSGNPYTLLWCRTSITGGITSATLLPNVNVDVDTWDATDLSLEIPEGSEGYYRLETHTALGSCGNQATLVAWSADIRVRSAPPDLTVTALYAPEFVPVQNVFTMSVLIENLSPGRVSEPFDVDFYVDPGGEPPPGRVGVVKQWVSEMSPYGTTMVTTVMWLPTDGVHQIWARVDTTNYVDEENEGNNAAGITVDAHCDDTGWRNPSADAPDSGGDNNGFERNPQNAYEDGGGYAESRDNGTGGNADRHRYYNYGFRIPPGASIQGIEVRLDWRLDSTSGTNYMEVDLSWNGGANWTSTRRDSTETTSEHTAVLGGDRWGRSAWSASDVSDTNFRVRVRAYSQYSSRDFFLDWIPVRVLYTNVCRAPEPPPWGDDSKPPGLIECTQLLQAGGFEGNPQNVFPPWYAGGLGAYQRSGYLQYEGAFSLRLHASLGSYPCQQNSYSPYLYQTVQIPTDVYSLTHIVVEGQRAVAGSLSPCSYPDSPDADDVLYVQMRDAGGNPISGSLSLVNGGAVTETWEHFSVDFTQDIDLLSRAGQNVRVYFYATHDQDYYGTFFYLDNLECNICTYWPIPDPEPGTSSVGGLVRALIGGVPRPMTGVEVWAYSQGGTLYHTRSIHDGTYHFYNIPPGTYTIYSEAWIGGYLRLASATVSVVADERNYNVNLLLQ